MSIEDEPKVLNKEAGQVPDRKGWPANVPSIRELMIKAGHGDLTKVQGIELDIPAYGSWVPAVCAASKYMHDKEVNPS